MRRRLVYMESMDPAAIGRTMIDVRKVIAKGFLGIKEEIEDRISRRDVKSAGSAESLRFWQAAATVCEAMAAFGGRYAEEAKRLAAREKDARRKGELERITEVCSRVPALPARTFHEALQSCWFTQLIALSEHGGEGPAPGRLDQYLYPFYRRDVDEGRITKEEAQELLDLYFLKGSETPKPRPSSSFIKFGRSGNINVNNHITIGGVDREGYDATNELSYMLLEAQSHIQLPRPQTSLRVHAGSPKELVDKAVRVNRLGGGLPQIIGDEVVVKGLVNRGLSLEDARDFTMLGCSTVCAHALYGRLHMGWYNVPKILELALNDGIDRVTKDRIGLATGDPRKFSSFDEVTTAFRAQLKYSLDALESGVVAETEALKERFPLIFTSVVLNDCIENGKDLTRGGARYNWGGTVTGVGVVTTGESLYAVKKAVFEDNVVTMAGLIDAIDADFEGREDLRQYLLNKVAKYGNDDDGVDGMVRQVAHWYYDEVERHKSPNGGKMWPEFHSVTFHVPLGMATGALPGGRKALTPHQTGITATSGADRKGPTALCRSAGKLDLHRANAASLFLTTTGEMVAADEKCALFADIIRTYLVDLGGLHVQTNVVDPETLREAQKNPEKYRHLVVRVAGYSAFFVELDKKLQDDIIGRTVQTL
jgi:formate C-acetyltransferase